MWVARDEDGDLHLFTKCPVRGKCHDYEYNEYNFWKVNEKFEENFYLEIPKNLFPDLKWEDNPIEVTIIRK